MRERENARRKNGKGRGEGETLFPVVGKLLTGAHIYKKLNPFICQVPPTPLDKC